MFLGEELRSFGPLLFWTTSIFSFLADLVRHLDLPRFAEFMRVGGLTWPLRFPMRGLSGWGRVDNGKDEIQGSLHCATR
jgi:hypothetical protein